MSKRQTFEHLELSNCSFINIFALTMIMKASYILSKRISKLWLNHFEPQLSYLYQLLYITNNHITVCLHFLLSLIAKYSDTFAPIYVVRS